MEDLTVSLIPLEDDSQFWQHFCRNVLLEVKDHVKQRIKKLFKDLYPSFANGLPDVNIMLDTDKIFELISSKYEEDLQISFLTAICSALQSITIFRKDVMKSRLKVYIEKIRELKGEGGKELQGLMKYEEQRTKAENILQVSLSSIEKKIRNNYEVNLSSHNLRYDWAKATKALSILVTSETSRKFAKELTTEAVYKMKKKKNCFELTLNAQEWIISLTLGLETIRCVTGDVMKQKMVYLHTCLVVISVHRYTSILDRSNFSPVTLLTNCQGNPHIPSLYQEKKRG